MRPRWNKRRSTGRPKFFHPINIAESWSWLEHFYYWHLNYFDISLNPFSLTLSSHETWNSPKSADERQLRCWCVWGPMKSVCLRFDASRDSNDYGALCKFRPNNHDAFEQISFFSKSNKNFFQTQNKMNVFWFWQNKFCLVYVQLVSTRRVVYSLEFKLYKYFKLV